METVATIPVKSYSERIPRKNFREFCGVPLYENFFKKLAPTNPFDEVYVDTDSVEIKEVADEYNFQVLDRPEYLTKDDANGNDLIMHALEKIEADYYFQLFVTAPLLRPDSISEAVRVLESSEHDSVLTATEEHTWYWFEGDPVNYDPMVLPRSQDAEPVIRESTGLYGIEREALVEYEARIGEDPHFLIVDDVEGVDIDNELALKIARTVAESL
jgi:CMP-N-acetylneuraminic acid synthetase